MTVFLNFPLSVSRIARISSADCASEIQPVVRKDQFRIAAVLFVSRGCGIDAITGFQLAKLFSNNNSLIANKSGRNERVTTNFLLHGNGFDQYLAVGYHVNRLSRFMFDYGALWNNEELGGKGRVFPRR
jgi:hypothetical protein